MRHTRLVNYALYQIGWFACVLGGASHRPWTGCLIALILVGVHLALAVERSLEVRLVVLAIGVGAVVEMMQIAAGTYRFTSGTVTDALPPPWLLAMCGPGRVPRTADVTAGRPVAGSPDAYLNLIHVEDAARAVVAAAAPGPVTDRMFLAMETGTSRCEWKGEARYWSVIVPGRRVNAAAWSYANPLPEYERIRGYFAFYPSLIECAVDSIPVGAQLRPVLWRMGHAGSRRALQR